MKLYQKLTGEGVGERSTLLLSLVWNKMNCNFLYNLMSLHTLERPSPILIWILSCSCFLFIPSLPLSPSSTDLKGTAALVWSLSKWRTTAQILRLFKYWHFLPNAIIHSSISIELPTEVCSNCKHIEQKTFILFQIQKVWQYNDIKVYMKAQ